MPKIAYQYEYQTDVKYIELTPHKRSAVWGPADKQSAVWGCHTSVAQYVGTLKKQPS